MDDGRSDRDHLPVRVLGAHDCAFKTAVGGRDAEILAEKTLVGVLKDLNHRSAENRCPAAVASGCGILGSSKLEDAADGIRKVGFYGLTYKADVDDVRDSPTLQMLSSLKNHLCGNRVKVYDPMVEKDIVPNQYHDLDEFLSAVELVVILVDHCEIKENMDKLKDKIVFDTRHVCSLEGAYHL